jgi:hypothetical protein
MLARHLETMSAAERISCPHKSKAFDERYTIDGVQRLYT